MWFLNMGVCWVQEVELLRDVIDRLPLYPESNSVPRFGAGGKAGAAQMRGKPPGL